MSKKVYTPNKFLDVVLSLAFTIVTAYVMYYIYKEGLYFWKLLLSVLIVSVVVPSIEVSLRWFGKWASEHYLGDEKHGDPLSKAYTLKKFVDQGWQFVYHSVFALWEYLLLKKHNWFNDTQIFIPVSEIVNPPDDIRLIFIVQIALWIFQAFRHVFVNQRKKDYYELFAHHIVTMCLCFVAYTSHYKSGLLILFLHDYSDILVDTLKILNLCNIAGEKDYFILEIEYACTLIVWAYERLYYFPYIFLVKEYKPMVEYYAGQTFLEIFKQEYIMILQGISLAVLYCLHWYWFILLCRIGFRAFIAERENYRKIQKDEYEGDSDSDSDSDDDEEEAKKKSD